MASSFEAKVRDKYGVVLLFGMITDSIIQILTMFLYASEDEKYKFLKYFSIILCAGLAYSSIFFCLKYMQKAMCRTVVAFLTVSKIAINVVFIWWYPQTDDGVSSVSYIFISLPAIFCSIALLGYTVFYHRVQRYMLHRRLTSEEYVKRLFNKRGELPVEYPTRIVVGQTMTAFAIYMISIYLTPDIINIINILNLVEIVITGRNYPMFIQVMTVTIPAIGIIYGWTQVYLSMLNCADHIRAARLGKLRSKYGSKDAINYIGYQIVYGVFSTTMIIFFYTIICTFVRYMFTQSSVWDFIWNVILAKYIGVPFVTFIIAKSTRDLIAKYVFSAEKYNPSHPRWFEFFEYMLVFVNILLATFSYFNTRILLPILSIILFSQRMDWKHGRLDSGFKSYYSVIVVDNERNNVVMHAFIDLLWKSIHRNPWSGEEELEILELKQRRNIARLRWFKAYTLIRNPRLYHF